MRTKGMIKEELCLGLSMETGAWLMVGILAGGFFVGLWYILIRGDADLDMRRGIVADGLRKPAQSSSFSSARSEFERKLLQIEAERRRRNLSGGNINLLGDATLLQQPVEEQPVMSEAPEVVVEDDDDGEETEEQMLERRRLRDEEWARQESEKDRRQLEEEEDLDMGPELTMEQLRAIRNSPYRYTAPRFEGSQYKFAEGGEAKEPVAKKTMPLLDMDGQEMDFREEGGFVPIGKKERADDVPARLSKNEFVMTADAVRGAGDGNIDKGAEKMYNLMSKLEAENDQPQGLDGARKMFQTSQRLEEVL